MPGAPPEQPKGEREDDAKASGDALARKQVNDAAAYIRGLAQLRERNAEWAEQAVREAVSLSASEALKLKVIDYLARDVAGLLRQLDGKTLATIEGEVRLQTADARLIEHAPDWRVRLLAVITNPSVALILMMIGIYGLILEFSNPGMGAGGVLGGICLILALYALTAAAGGLRRGGADPARHRLHGGRGLPAQFRCARHRRGRRVRRRRGDSDRHRGTRLRHSTVADRATGLRQRAAGVRHRRHGTEGAPPAAGRR